MRSPKRPCPPTPIPSPHLYTFPQLAACVLLGFYLNVSYRDLEEWLRASDRVCQALELEQVPDHTTLYRAYQRLRMRDLEEIKRVLLEKLGVEEEVMASDSTGFRLTQASHLQHQGVQLLQPRLPGGHVS